ncbi:hypothetical protein CCUS01_10123 [Colletotrichum cuscutae]|uniref:Uncharacterized protein n=1 Tax=Colletotrichum cuscutae TaxID=1209917 RepID=A0AAI9UG28_9PEZI|nr:hypothetical protein CCUS01_10123 [Colletotrichum cuscutae]
MLPSRSYSCRLRLPHGSCSNAAPLRHVGHLGDSENWKERSRLSVVDSSIRSTAAHSLVGRNGGPERTRSEPDGKGPETTTHTHGKSKYRLNSSICARRSSLLSLGAFLSAPARRAVLPLHCNFATGTPDRPSSTSDSESPRTSHTHPVTHSPSYTCAAV